MSGKRQTRASAPKPQGARAITRSSADLWHMIAVAAIALVAALRPLMSETYTSALHGIATALGGIDLTPATTAWMDLLIWSIALLATFRLAIRKQRWRWTGLELGAVLLLVGAIVSTLYTGDQRTAINASADWLSAVMLIMIVAQVIRTRMGTYLILAAIAASGAASAAKCVMFETVERGEMIREYNADKERIWTSQGIALDDPQVELFEKRLQAGEASGFLPFSNAEGSLLVLCGFASLALTERRSPVRWHRLAPWIVAVLVWSAILLTHSRGAILSLVVAFILWLALRPLLYKIAQRWRKAWVLFWIVTLTAGLIVVSYGLWRGGLPTDSLRFRWNYWQVSSHIIADHPWTGTGAGNFDRAYMKHKPIDFPEEVDDPHNFVISILAQWGIFGLAGLVLMVLGGTYVLFRGLPESATRAEESTDPDRSPTPLSRSYRVWILIMALAFLVLRESIVASTGGAVADVLVFFDVGIYGVIWCIVFAGLGLIANDPTVGAKQRPLLLKLTLAIGVLAFLLHNTIGFSLFIPATLTPWAVMLGLLLAGTSPVGRPSQAGVVRWMAPAVATAGAVALILLVVVPVTRTNRLLTEARNTPMPQAADLYRQAAHADPLDATPWAELAEREARQTSDMEAPLRALARAQERDPGRIALYRQSAQAHYYRFGKLTEPDRKLSELRQAVAAARQAERRYPASPDDQALLGAMMAELGVYTRDAEILQEGIRHLQNALDLDAARGPGEIRRKPQSWRAEIQTRIADLQRQLQNLRTPATHGAS